MLISHSRTGTLSRAIELFESAGKPAAVCFDADSTRHQLEIRHPEALLLGEKILGGFQGQLCREIKESPLLEHIPIFLLAEGTSSVVELGEEIRLYIDGVVQLDHPDPLGIFEAELKRFRRGRYDELSGLLSGASLDRKLRYLCDSPPFSWTLIVVKVFGVHPYNIQHGCEEGDRLIVAVAELLEEVLDELGLHTDVAGRIAGTRMCIITTTRRIETVCNKLIGKAERAFRRFYTPYEWMKGFMTVEHEKYGGDYHLAEIVIACIQVPSQWEGHPEILHGISREMIGDIERKGEKYRIVSAA
ncbi:MAG: diguanylate cyclase [bacterium]